MKVPYDEGVANHIDPESCGDVRKDMAEALTGESAGRAIEPRNESILSSADDLWVCGRQYHPDRQREIRMNSTRSKNHGTHGNTLHGNREILVPTLLDCSKVRTVNPKGARR